MTQICERRFEAMQEPLEYPSSSSDKTYKVYLFPDETRKFPMCTCWAYLTKRKKIAKELGRDWKEVAGDCKHLREAMADTCMWTEEDGGYQFSGSCPRCGYSCVDVDDSGNKVETSREDAIASLKALREKRAASS